MKRITYTNYRDTELAKNKALRDSYNILEGEFSLVHALIQKRLERNITQRELARRIGSKQSAISRIESGQANPSVRILQKIAHALDARLSIAFH